MGHIILVLVVMCGMFYACGMGVNYMEERSCYETAAAMGVKASYNFWTPCIVEVDGKKMRLEDYRTFRLNVAHVDEAL